MMFGGGDDDDNLKKARNASLIAGIIFGIAWWVYIDGAAYGSHVDSAVAAKAAGYHWLPGLGVTIAFIMINGMDWSELSEDGMVASRARCFLITSMLIGLGCIAAALYIMVSVFLNNPEAEEKWTGIAVFVQCLLIFLSAFVMRFGNMPSEDGLGF